MKLANVLCRYFEMAQSKIKSYLDEEE
jgi:hypothetical protein